MRVGEAQTASIDSREPWNHTGIRLTAGEQYGMHASGTWVDWFIPHGPDGGPSDSFYLHLLESRRRRPHDNWFALIGALDENLNTAFTIGSQCTFTAPGDGELTCFANDLEHFYFNNHGAVTLTVTRIA